MPFSSGTYAGCIDFFDFCGIRCLFSEILPPEASISAFSRGFDAFYHGFFLRKHQFRRFSSDSMPFLQDSSAESINFCVFPRFRCFCFGILLSEASISSVFPKFDAFTPSITSDRAEALLILQTLGHKQQQVIIVNAGRILIQYLTLIPHSASVRNISALYVYPLRRTVTRMNSHSQKNSI